MKIVWAVDPLAKKVPFSKLARLLHALARKSQIEAVYVAGRIQRINLLSNPSYAQSLLEKTLGRVPEVGARTVLWNVTGSQSDEVNELLQHAIKAGADLLAVYSHGPGVVERFFFGSFAEAVATYSPLPVLLAKPNSPLPKNVERILFATDFSVGAMRAYKDLLELASKENWRLVVFHASDPFHKEGSRESMQYYNLLRKRLESIEVMAAHAKTEVLTVTDNQFSPVARLILENAARYNCNLVSTAGQQKSTRQKLLGSVTRQLIRESPLPILVMRN